MKAGLFLLFCLLSGIKSFCWGFYAHRQINYYAVFLLPPEMMVFYKPSIGFLTEHAVDPDKRRYAIAEEGPRHFIDIDHYGVYPFPNLPHQWQEAVNKFSKDTLMAHGIGPWWIQTMLFRLTTAFKEKNRPKILKLSAELGHYIADIHVPLHTSGNHNGQLTGQQGIHGFWESRIPELLAEKEWDFFIGRARYINDPAAFIWQRVYESAAASDTVLRFEKRLNDHFPRNLKYAFEERNGFTIRQYSEAYTIRYNKMLNNMVERRMRQSIFAVASFWYTAWVNAGQPNLKNFAVNEFSEAERKEFENLTIRWQEGANKGPDHDSP